MYERFTDRARRVMQLANQEAQRFNHEFVGTEHILLGLVREGSGVAAAVLKGLDVDLRKIRLEVEKLVQSGPEMVTMGKLPFTPRARQVIELTMNTSRELGDNHVGTEHLLLGLLLASDGVACQVLTALGITHEAVLSDTLLLLGRKGNSSPQLEKMEPVHEAWDIAPDVMRVFNAIAAMPVVVRAVQAAVAEMGPQPIATEIKLSPETAGLLCQAKLALDGKMPVL